MTLIRLDHVHVSFSGVPVLEDLSLELSAGARLGVVGENGSGKSTVLRLIAGLLRPESGSVHVARGARVVHVPQIPEPAGSGTSLESALALVPGLAGLRATIARLEADPGDGLQYAEAIAGYAELGGYELEHELMAGAEALGLPPDALSRPFASLSGGERARLLLAAALAAEPDVLLLDEPDNHLDWDGAAWLEERLSRFRGAAVLVTHDRELLDRAVDAILEIEDGRGLCERGGYSAYLERKRERIELQKRQWLEQQRRVRQLKAAIRRAEETARNIENETIHFHYRKRALKVARRAVTLKGRLERQLTGEAAVEVPREERDRIRVQMEAARTRRGAVLQLAEVGKRLGERRLFGDVHLSLSRGERLAVLGPNGSGKSTLLRIALGLEPPDGGHVWRSGAADVFYCDQHHGGLDLALTVGEVLGRETDLGRTQQHYLLAQMLLGPEALYKRVEQLIGGERTRLVLALLMNTRADLLVLDEPTNHLDLPSLEVLEEALAAFSGAVLLVSHERRLVEAVATDALELRGGRALRVA
jgi:ATP-binding cassette, subfamily F, member 3